MVKADVLIAPETLMLKNPIPGSCGISRARKPLSSNRKSEKGIGVPFFQTCQFYSRPGTGRRNRKGSNGLREGGREKDQGKETTWSKCELIALCTGGEDSRGVSSIQRVGETSLKKRNEGGAEKPEGEFRRRGKEECPLGRKYKKIPVSGNRKTSH